MYRILLTGIFVALIAGCGSAPTQEEDFLKYLGTISIISLLGDEISLQHADNKRARSNVTDWQLDDFAVRAAKDSLTSREHKFANLRYQVASLFKVYDDNNSNTDPKINNILPDLKMLLRNYPANTFMIIYRNNAPDFVVNTDTDLIAQGLYHRTKLFSADTVATFSTVRIDLVRTRDFSVLASATGNAHTLLSPEHWEDGYNNSSNATTPLNSTHRKNIQSNLRKDIDNSISKALMALGL